MLWVVGTAILVIRNECLLILVFRRLGDCPFRHRVYCLVLQVPIQTLVDLLKFL